MPIPAFRLAAGAGALALLAIQIHGATEHTEGGSAFALSSQIAALCALAVVPVMSVVALQQRREGIAALLMAVTACFLMYTLPTTVDRSAALRENSEAITQAREQSQLQLKMAQSALSVAIDKMERECASGVGPKCRGWREVVTQRESYVSRLTVSQPQKIEKKTHGITVLSWALFGLSERALRYLSALGNAVGLDLGIATLAAFAAHGHARERETPAPVPPSKPERAPTRVDPPRAASGSLGETWIAQYVSENPDADPKEAYQDYQEALRGRGGKRMQLRSFKKKFEELRT